MGTTPHTTWTTQPLSSQRLPCRATNVESRPGLQPLTGSGGRRREAQTGRGAAHRRGCRARSRSAARRGSQRCGARPAAQRRRQGSRRGWEGGSVGTWVQGFLRWGAGAARKRAAGLHDRPVLLAVPQATAVQGAAAARRTKQHPAGSPAPTSVLCRRSMAASWSRLSPKMTKPKPRERPVILSIITTASVGLNSAKAACGRRAGGLLRARSWRAEGGGLRRDGGGPPPRRQLGPAIAGRRPNPHGRRIRPCSRRLAGASALSGPPAHPPAAWRRPGARRCLPRST